MVIIKHLQYLVLTYLLTPSLRMIMNLYRNSSIISTRVCLASLFLGSRVDVISKLALLTLGRNLLRVIRCVSDLRKGAPLRKRHCLQPSLEESPFMYHQASSEPYCTKYLVINPESNNLNSVGYSVFMMHRRTDLWGPDGIIGHFY